jgi:hypothetical protein
LNRHGAPTLMERGVQEMLLTAGLSAAVAVTAPTKSNTAISLRQKWINGG